MAGHPAFGVGFPVTPITRDIGDRRVQPLVILSVGGATEGSDAESKDPDDLSRDHAAAGSSLETLSFDFQFWQFWQSGVPGKPDFGLLGWNSGDFWQSPALFRLLRSSAFQRFWFSIWAILRISDYQC
jgi:hypothetical protein